MFKPLQGVSLQEQFINLVEKNHLEKIKYWIRQTNLKNSLFIVEDKEIAKEEGYSLFYYWDVALWSLEIASFNGFKNLLEYFIFSPDYQKKPILREEKDGSCTILTQAKDQKIFEYLAQSGALENLSYAIQKRFHGLHEAIISNLMTYFIYHDEKKIPLLLQGLSPELQDNDSHQIQYAQTCLDFAQRILPSMKLQYQLENSLNEKKETGIKKL